MDFKHLFPYNAEKYINKGVFPMILPNYYENLQTLHVQTMPERAYYIPASHDMGPLVHNRTISDRFQLLNGLWNFRYFETIYDLEEFFPENALTFLLPQIPSPYQAYGRTTVTAGTNIPISATRSHLIRLMSQ